MFVYSGLLWWMNSRALPRAIRITRLRAGVMLFSFLAFGFLAVFTIIDQVKKL
jgi:hypothetical protein